MFKIRNRGIVITSKNLITTTPFHVHRYSLIISKGQDIFSQVFFHKAPRILMKHRYTFKALPNIKEETFLQK